MDSTNTSGQPRNRDIMYCHNCENEWYRDEHGLTCPECQSDFTEIVEANNDPREEQLRVPADTPPAQDHDDTNAPDPDEGDIDGLRWEQTGPDRYRVRGTVRQNITMRRGEQPQGQAGGGLMSVVGSLLQGMLGNAQAQQQQQQGEQGRRPPSRPASAPGSPPPEGQPRGSGTFIRHGHGPGFSYTIATSSNANIGGGLFPRNANGPQPFQNQPEPIQQMLHDMMMNIGVPTMHPGVGGPHDHGMHPGFGPQFIIGGPHGGMPPFGNLFQLFAPPGGVLGDAVYTQEALDRIMTQLMEQHQAGNAPGPASESAIENLPKRAITKGDQGDNGKAECSICMDEVELGDPVTVLPCSHWFHHDCVKAWLSEHDTCPHCRRGIMPKEGGRESEHPRSPTQAPLHDMHSPQMTRPAGVPGAYPFPSQPGSGSGTAQSPFVVPDSPEIQRGTTNEQSNSSSSGGMFSRMRDAFGRGSSSGGNEGSG